MSTTNMVSHMTSIISRARVSVDDGREQNDQNTNFNDELNIKSHFQKKDI